METLLSLALSDWPRPAESCCVVVDGGFKCKLCSTGTMTYISLESHKLGSKHQGRLRAEYHRRQRVLDMLEWNDAELILDTRAKALGCSKWTKAIQRSLFCSLAEMRRLSNHCHEDEQHSPTCTEIAVAPVRKLLSQMEDMERVSLLEQSVWKTLCVTHFPRPLTNLLEVQEWQKQGWKTAKEDFRHDSGIHIIVSNVLPFLIKKKI